MKEDRYTKRETDLIHEALTEKLDLILEQTTKHNGRLTTLERWMWTIAGATAIFGLLEFDKIIGLFI